MNTFRLRKRRFMFGLVTVLLSVALVGGVHAQTQPASTQPASVAYAPPPARAATLGTTFIDWDALAVRTTATGQSRAVFDNPTPDLEKFEMHITTLRDGMLSHPPHHHAWEEMLIVKEGELEESINGKPCRAGPGSIIFLASHDVHSVRNPGDKTATYYVLNFYTDRVHTVPNKPAAEQGVPGMLPSGVIDCNSMPATPTATGSTTNVVDSATLTFPSFSSHITMLNVGQSTRSEMVDSADELFILKSGQLEATVNGVACRLMEGSFFYCAPNDKRTLKNIGTTPASYLVIRIALSKSANAGGR